MRSLATLLFRCVVSFGRVALWALLGRGRRTRRAVGIGVVYVLDEPSAGLHPADTEALLRALERLKSSGNSLFARSGHSVRPPTYLARLAGAMNWPTHCPNDRRR
jgi:hypothetical protein